MLELVHIGNKGGYFMKGFILDYINENEFKKLERALKKYNMLAYKKLNFECQFRPRRDLW